MNLTVPFLRRAPRAFPWGRPWPRSYLRSVGALLSLFAAGAFLARAPLELCVVAVAGTAACLAILLRPTLALYGLAFAVPFGSLRELSLGGMTIGANHLLVLGLTVAWLLRMAAFRRVRLARSPLTAALFCYLGTMAISLWAARDLVPATKEMVKWVELLLLYLFVASPRDFLRASEPGPGERRALVAALLLAGILQGALGIYQFVCQVGPPGFVLLGRYMRAHGTFSQPNPFGGYLGLLLPLAYAMALTLWPEALHACQQHRLWSITLWTLAILASVVMLTALVMSWSRGAMLGFAIGAGLVALALLTSRGLALGRRVWTVMAIIALVLLLASPALPTILPGGLVERLTDFTRYLGTPDLTAIEITDENFATIERLAHWDAAWRMFAIQPWLGVGTGQYASVYPSVSLPRWEDPLGHAHNYYLNVLAEGGLLGLAGYLGFALVALLIAWRSARKERGWRRGLALGALGMLGHLLAHGVFDNLFVHEMYLVVAMVLGMAASLRDRSSLSSAGQEAHTEAT